MAKRDIYMDASRLCYAKATGPGQHLCAQLLHGSGWGGEDTSKPTTPPLAMHWLYAGHQGEEFREGPLFNRTG